MQLLPLLWWHLVQHHFAEFVMVGIDDRFVGRTHHADQFFAPHMHRDSSGGPGVSGQERCLRQREGFTSHGHHVQNRLGFLGKMTELCAENLLERRSVTVPTSGS